MNWIGNIGQIPTRTRFTIPWAEVTTGATISIAFSQSRRFDLPGNYIFLVLGILLAILMLIGIFTRPLQEASGEVLPPMEDIKKEEKIPSDNEEEGLLAWFRPEGGRKQLLMYIITDHPHQIAESILERMNRGVTKLDATGMYTGDEHAVLMCALTVTEISPLKAVVKEIDPDAFVVLVPAKGVMGEGFEPLNK